MVSPPSPIKGDVKRHFSPPARCQEDFRPRHAESPRGISPRGAHRSGREPLDSSGSCHRMKGWRLSAKTSRFLPFPVDLSILAPVTYPLSSTDITPLQQYYGVVRPWLAHRYFRPRGSAACAFSLGITNQVLKFRAKARMRFTPPLHRTPHGP